MSTPVSAPLSVLVVDDSGVIRRFVTDVLNAAGDIRVVASASNGEIALERLAARVPDVVVLDVEMPVLDGLETLERIRHRWPDLPVVMFSTLTTRGATATLDALARGATDYVPKPAHLGDLEAARRALAASLVPVVRNCATVRRVRQRLARSASSSTPERRVASRPAVFRPRAARCEIVVLASSTGGPHALGEVIPALPGDLPAPVLIVQHMPPLFTRLLAERLDERSALVVHHAEEGEILERGHAYLAPGGSHLMVRRGRDGVARVALDDGPPENSVKPAADVLFRSVAELYGARVCAAVLTGMGADGLAGSRAIRQAGGVVLAQDEATSVIWGMPGAVVRENLADAQVALPDVARALALQVGALAGVTS